MSKSISKTLTKDKTIVCGGKCKVLILVIMPLLIKQFLLYKKLFVRINYHQLLNEYVLQNCF